jgi:hypothetical protein
LPFIVAFDAAYLKRFVIKTKLKARGLMGIQGFFLRGKLNWEIPWLAFWNLETSFRSLFMVSSVSFFIKSEEIMVESSAQTRLLLPFHRSAREENF